MRIVEIGQHLVVDPRVCHGKLTFKGTRVPVETVLYFLSEGRGFKQLLKGWPEIKCRPGETSQGPGPGQGKSRQ